MEQKAIAGHVWVLSGLRLGCAHTKRKAPCKPKAPGQTQHLNPTQPANPRPWESTLVSLSLGLGGELGHFQVLPQQKYYYVHTDKEGTQV